MKDWVRTLFGGDGRPTYGRPDMDDAIKRIVVPELRAMGFKGSMPHLRRARDGNFDLLTFQFASWGGSFCIEAARCPPSGIDAPGGHVAAEKAKAWDMPRRYRIGAARLGSDNWYDFDRTDPDTAAREALKDLHDPKVWQIVETLPLSWDEARQ